MLLEKANTRASQKKKSFHSQVFVVIKYNQSKRPLRESHCNSSARTPPRRCCTHACWQPTFPHSRAHKSLPFHHGTLRIKNWTRTRRVEFPPSCQASHCDDSPRRFRSPCACLEGGGCGALPQLARVPVQGCDGKVRRANAERCVWCSVVCAVRGCRACRGAAHASSGFQQRGAPRRRQSVDRRPLAHSATRSRAHACSLPHTHPSPPPTLQARWPITLRTP